MAGACCVACAREEQDAGGASGAAQQLWRVPHVLAKGGARLGGSAVLFAGAAFALAQSNRATDSEGDGDLSSDRIPWEVCGFPQTVHGGLTAALVDETLGGLAVALWRSGQLGFRPPAYTARLEVDYKRKIPCGSVILVSTEVEKVADRKVWMRATVTNGKGTVYATGRSLFVAPRWIPDWIKSLTGRGGGKGEKQDK
eukprot:XP_001695861.1 predicted protein [Chlamydomonas reinhardtii]